MAGVQAQDGSINVALNDSTSTGAYTKDGKLRVTDAAGSGLYDASGAIRISVTVGQGVYKALAAVLRVSAAETDGAVGIQFNDGSIRMTGTGGGSTYVPTYYIYGF